MYSLTMAELEVKLEELRVRYKETPTRILEIQGKLLKYALELKRKKAKYYQPQLDK